MTDATERAHGGNRAGRSAAMHMLAGIFLILVAILALVVLAALERRWKAGIPWHDAIRTLDVSLEDPDAIPVWSWELSPQQSVGNSEIAQAVQQDLLDKIAINKVAPERLREESPVVAMSSSDMLDESLIPRARIVMFDRDAALFEEVLDSGRLPVAGKRELLAGPLVSDRDLQIGGETYSVVGKLHPNVSGFVKTFVMPRDDATREALTLTSTPSIGSVHLHGASRLAELVPGMDADTRARVPVVYGGETLTRLDIAWGVWLSLLVVATGAVWSFMALLRLMATRNMGFLNSTFQEVAQHSYYLWMLYLFLFGGFFGAMALGIRDVEMNYLFTEFASHQFSKGGLKYVGDAYLSGHIPNAAHATFWNNFVVQTLLYGALPSQILLGIGALKTLASFIVVGFAMAPVWSGTAMGMTYHAITLALELPPYVLAAFGMLVWAHAVASFFWSPVRVWYLGDKAHGVPVIQDAARRLPRAFSVMAGTLLISGVLLYIAAWYEATTLILFR